MFELDFYKKPASQKNADGKTKETIREQVEFVWVTRWEEHCLECSAPLCFSTCNLYAKRDDKMCQRFYYGIYPDKNLSGLYDYGAEITFKKWGKLETRLNFPVIAKNDLIKLERQQRKSSLRVKPFFHILSQCIPIRKINPFIIQNHFRKNTLHKKLNYLARRTIQPDLFYLKAFSYETESYRLNLEIIDDTTVKYRNSLTIDPGYNEYSLDFAEFHVSPSGDNQKTKMLIYPENNREARITFTWLNFITFKKNKNTEKRAPAKKVKCLIWDLDNTIWEGILSEDGQEKLRLKPGIIELIKSLDEKGILQSIASKNDHDPAIKALERFGIREYFIYPEINWLPKSENIKKIAASLNLGINAFAFIDDSAFERGEVAEHIPEMRVYKDDEYQKLSDYDEFDVMVTAESRTRRKMYLEESQRTQDAAISSGNYDDFLRNCQIVAGIYKLTSKETIERSFELILRTNQLNTSTHRYDRPTFEALIASPATLGLAITCTDKYGSYGQVGYITLQLGNRAEIVDFVLSCRVARKKVEFALFDWLREYCAAQNYQELYIKYVKTERNILIKDLLDEMGFTNTDTGYLVLSITSPLPYHDIVKIEDHLS